MKNATKLHTQITIPNPCREDWSGMELTEMGRYCSQCSKSVVDFTRFTELQLRDYLEKNCHTPICGRIPISKLNKPLDVPLVKQHNSGWWLFATFAITGLPFQAQGKTDIVNTVVQRIYFEQPVLVESDTSYFHVKGFLVDKKTQERLPFAVIQSYRNTLKCVTDVNGEFELKLPANLKSDENIDVTISYVGYKTKQLDYVYSHLIAMQGSTLQLELELFENSIIGMVIYQRPPWHKRVWYRMKRFFKHKSHETE